MPRFTKKNCSPHVQGKTVKNHSCLTKDLVLNMGYSHPVKMITPQELSVQVETPTSVVVTGTQKDMVGEFAAKIRAVRPPEPYKGKGIAYEGEIIRRKAGKTGK